MTDQNLSRIVELAVAFKNAAEASPLIKAPQAQQKVLDSIDSAEMEKIQGLMQEVISDSFQYMFGGEPSEEFLKKNLVLCEISADFCLRALPEAKVATFVPKELKNQTDADTLRSLGAPKLAGLCEFKK
jgi:hypothetical protein